MILLGNRFVFRDPDTGEGVPVEPLPDDLDKLTEDVMYLVGGHIYDYVGTCPNALELKHAYPDGGAFGRLAKNPNKIIFYDYVDEEHAEPFSVKNIMDQATFDDIETRMDTSTDASFVIGRYFQTFDDGNNLAATIKQRQNRDGLPYIPSFRPTDDPLERLLKITVASMKIISAESRNQMDKDYEFDNLVSTFEGMTKHTSIDKIMDWCKFLQLHWEFTVFGLEDHEWQITDDISVSSTQMPWVDIVVEDQKNVFKVELVEDEDPLKRLTKLFLDKMSCPSKFYQNKGSTPHLVNNMKSALKSKQKMTMKYFMNWCNLLGLGFGFQFTRPDGIWYKSIGYSVTTNDPDRYALDLVSGIIPGDDNNEQTSE